MNWIKCTDRMPQKGEGLVVIFPDRDEVNVAVYAGKRWSCIDGCAGYGDNECTGDCLLNPTHWMPLPEPPTEN